MSLPSLTDSLDRSVSGEPWHGPSIESLLDGVREDDAFARPIAGAHNVAELVLHVAAWIREVASRLEGHPPKLPSAGDWPDPGPPSAAGWGRARGELANAQGALSAALDQFSDARLSDLVGAARDAPLGTGLSFEGMLMGLAQHNAYHGGQIAIVLKAARGTPAPR